MSKESSSNKLLTKALVKEEELFNSENIPVDEILKRLYWAAVSVPAPKTELHRLKDSLYALTPEELHKIRGSAQELKKHHQSILDYLQQIMDVVYENGYLAPARVK